jgi:hypothetical protein
MHTTKMSGSLKDILLGAGFITRRYPYAEHVNIEFAQQAMRA